MIYYKFCLNCHKAYDQGLNLDVCILCRKKEREVKKEIWDYKKKCESLLMTY